MKKITWILGFLMVILLGSLLSQEIAENEINMIKGEICRRMKVDAKVIEGPALKKVFTGTFYKVKLSRQHPSGSIFGMGNLMLVKTNGSFVIPEDIATDKPMPQLKGLVQKDFKLKNRQNAELIQQALDSIYPLKSLSDKGAVGIRQNGDQWLLIRGKFFEKSKGFIFTVLEGNITEIKYSLNIKLP